MTTYSDAKSATPPAEAVTEAKEALAHGCVPMITTCGACCGDGDDGAAAPCGMCAAAGADAGGAMCGAGAEPEVAEVAAPGEAAEAAAEPAAAEADADADAVPPAAADAAAEPAVDAAPAAPAARARRVQFAPLPPPLPAEAAPVSSQGACTQDGVATLAAFACEAAATLPICAALRGCSTPVERILCGLPKVRASAFSHAPLHTCTQCAMRHFPARVHTHTRIGCAFCAALTRALIPAPQGVRQLLPALGARTLGELGMLRAGALSGWPAASADTLLRRLRDAAAVMPKQAPPPAEQLEQAEQQAGAVVEGVLVPMVVAAAVIVAGAVEHAEAEAAAEVITIDAPPLPALQAAEAEPEAMEVVEVPPPPAAEAPPCADAAAPPAAPPAALPAPPAPPLPCVTAPAPTAAPPPPPPPAAADVAWLFSELSRLAAAPQWGALLTDEGAACDGDGDALMGAQGALLGMSVRLHAALARRSSGGAGAAAAGGAPVA
jgi:hypothetical protein